MLNNSRQENTLPVEPSELIVNADGSAYHLAVRPDQLAETVIVVGDQNRVAQVSKHFDSIEFQISNREFITHTGKYKGKRVTVMSTGIGTDNIDIVLNELDALVNFDLSTRMIRKEKKSLRIVRLGTSGSLQENIPVDSAVVSQYAIGFDGVLPFYQTAYESDELDLTSNFIKHTGWNTNLNPPYAVRADQELFNLLSPGNFTGITATANGFYGPQGRVLRLSPAMPDLNEKFNTFQWKNLKLTNYEMETSALYGLSGLLGHKACTICAIIANRYIKAYSKDYHKTIDVLIEQILNRLTT